MNLMNLMGLITTSRKLIGYLNSTIKSLLSPPFCYVCTVFLREDKPLCRTCQDTIKPLIPIRIPLTRTKKITVHAVGAYTEPLTPFIVAKNKSDRSAAILLAQLIYTETPIATLEFDYFVPVPLHWTRYAWRGYNQAAEMAYELAKLCKKPVLSCVKRTHNTPPQYHVTGDQRAGNVENVFQATSSAALIRNKKIMLVDDVITTGSTLTAVAKAIVPMRPKDICAIVGARSLREMA